MTFAKLSLAALIAAAAVTPALADDDGSPLGAYLQSISAPARATDAQPAAKVIEGRQARHMHMATPAVAPTPTPAPLTDAERYLNQR